MSTGEPAEESAAPLSTEAHRAGFVALVGRPNTGKSTLTNALVGEKIAITSDRPQTTRRLIRGVANRPNGQLILVDTPGLHRPKTLLGRRLNDAVAETLADVDVIAVCLPVNEPAGPGDRLIISQVTALNKPVIAVVTKIDKVPKAQLAPRLLEVSQLAEFADIVPLSAIAGTQLDVLADVLIGHLPLSPPLYDNTTVTDEPLRIRIAELVREAALDGVRDELPHSITVLVEDVQTEKNLTTVYAELYVERSSQKAIVIGQGGSRLRDVGTRARKEIEDLLGNRVYLNLHIRVAADWQRDPKQLRKLGF